MPAIHLFNSWRERDAALFSLARRHVITMRHIFPLFPSRQTAYRRVKRLLKIKQLRKVGELMLQDTGPPESVFCTGWKPKYDQLYHEVMLTNFLLHYDDAAEIVRGWYVDRTLRPDAEVTLNKQLYYIELDTGSMTMGQVRRRQRVYRSTEDIILYVTLGTQRRMQNLMNASELIENRALFTTLEQIETEGPAGKVWLSRSGEFFSIC